ncbi:hypothetical protein MSG28_003187 [Choristoneura fumiferana]|uniref:Uncharacterized protein n=1 Tax=Choristoneura fumiferana TaxID=7141 RepID=A0ACC0KDY7_CHOFU|nr:hypothetical protein MSG28_003187 [Choristoneura fumiferana]
MSMHYKYNEKVKKMATLPIFVSLSRSTVPWSCEKIKVLSQRNQKIQPFLLHIFDTRKGIRTYRLLPVNSES